MRKFALLGVVGVVVVVGAAVLGAMWFRVQANEPFRGYSGPEQFLEIGPGTSTAAIGRRLVEAGVVSSDVLFRAAVRWSGQSRNLKAGEYRFDEALSVLVVVEMLARGDVYALSLTIPEGLTIVEMADLYESSELGQAQSFIEAAQDAAVIRVLDPNAGDLEGYLFPDTYALPRSAAATDLVDMMARRFLAVYDERLQQLAAEQGLSTREVVTLASLIEKETGQADERALVAAVYRNRLRIGMGMQADPTVVYALRLAGRYNGNIRREDLQIDSPYNTYRYRGLPPGPIAAPGRASLEAALEPADVSYLYFVSRNDGTHAFADTLVEHNRNVRQYQVLYFQRPASGQSQ